MQRLCRLLRPAALGAANGTATAARSLLRAPDAAAASVGVRSLQSRAARRISDEMLLSVSMNAAPVAPATSQAELVAQLEKNGSIKSARVGAAMRLVDRAHFAVLPLGTPAPVSTEGMPSPYAHAPAPIGQLSTISSPYSHALALEALESVVVAGARVLDVGSGSGYLTACLASLVGPTGRVVALEHSSVLLMQSRRNLLASDACAPLTKRIDFAQADAADPTNEWLAQSPRVSEGSFDVVHAGVAFPTLPLHFLRVLRIGGRILVPVGPSGAQQLLLVEKLAEGEEEDAFKTTVVMACSYASIAKNAPATDVDHVSSILRERDGVTAKLDAHRAALFEWQRNFVQSDSREARRAANNLTRKPTAAEMQADPVAKALMAEVSPLVKKKAQLDRAIERCQAEASAAGAEGQLDGIGAQGS